MQGLNDPNRELLDASALCRQLVPKGSVEAFLADHRHELFPDEMFEDLFPSKRGRPSIPADIVASVMVLQALEGLSDREAATGAAGPDQLEGGLRAWPSTTRASTTRSSPTGALGCATRRTPSGSSRPCAR